MFLIRINDTFCTFLIRINDMFCFPCAYYTLCIAAQGKIIMTEQLFECFNVTFFDEVYK